jgi:hypothetical protein
MQLTDDQAIARQRDVNNQARRTNQKNNIKREELGSRERNRTKTASNC